MNSAFRIVIIILIYAYCTTVTCWAFVDYRFLPFKSNSQIPPGTDEAGEPVFLTPLLDADKLSEAKHRSWLKPAIGGIRSHAGYLTVNRTTKSHLYFWFIPKTDTTDYTNTPLILWLQGGPGCSSLFGLFGENGPFKVTKKGLQKRVHAWTNHYHMLYIDQPVGTGFSFTENQTAGYVNTQEGVAEHLYEALIQFYKLFFKIKDHDLYIAGESYGGKYVPALGYKIHTANRQPNTQKIPLKGLMIGNGLSDPENMMVYAEYAYGLGLIDEKERVKLESIQEKIKSSIRSEDWSNSGHYFGELIADMLRAMNFTEFYDYTREKFDGGDSFVEFLGKDEIRKSIHVGHRPYQVCSHEVGAKFQEDIMKSVRPWIQELLEHYRILFYNGQFDIVCAYPLTENVLRNLHWSGASAYGQAKKQIWRVGNKVAGYYRSAGNLVEVLVRDASHMAPADQPKNMLILINRFIGQWWTDNSTHVLHL